MTAATQPFPGFETYLVEIARHDLLSASEERALSRRYRAGSSEARDALIVANLRLVVMVARRFRNRGLEMGELVAEGNLGLIRAVEKFDPEAGFRFSTYGVWWIQQAIRRSVERRAHTRLPSYMISRLTAWRRTVAALAAARGRLPTTAEVAHRLGLEPLAVRGLQSALETAERGWLSLDAAPNGDGQWMEEVLADPAAKDPTEDAELESELGRLRLLLAALDERSRRILELRFGIGLERPLTLVEVGERFGLTRERVRQLEKRALSRLQVAFKHGVGALRPIKRRGQGRVS